MEGLTKKQVGSVFGQFMMHMAEVKSFYCQAFLCEGGACQIDYFEVEYIVLTHLIKMLNSKLF